MYYKKNGFGVKNDQKVSHNMILMSKYKGQKDRKKTFFLREGFPNLYFLVCWFLSFQNSSTHSLLLLYYNWHKENNPIDFRSWDKENTFFWADFQKYFHIGTLVH